jgi:hypothetical protein
MEMPSLPAEGLRFLPGTQDQLHAIVGALARFLRMEVVGQRFVGGAAQHAHIRRPSAIVSSIAISSASNTGVLCGTIGPRQRNFDVVHVRGDVGRGDRQRRGQDARRIMVLGDADPVEPQFLDGRLRSTMP